jgi:hypothetical protein
MAKLENEIVKFIAEVEMDPQKVTQYQLNLTELEKHNESLRKAISDTTKKMDELRAEGKEGTEEFKRYEIALQADIKALRESTKQADKYSAALGINSMSLQQLQKHAKTVRSAMNAMHKEANPELWAKYEKELQAVNRRMDEIRGGSARTSKALSGMFSQVIPTFVGVRLGMKGIHAAQKLIEKGFETWTKATQKVGDAITIEMAGIESVFDHFFRSLSKGRDEITLTYREVYKLAKEAAALRDEIFELQNSYNITAAAAVEQMNEYEATMRDASKPIEERKTALKNLQELEQGLAKDRLLIAQQQEDAAYKVFKTETALEKDEAEYFVGEYLEAKKKGIVESAKAFGQAQNDLESLRAKWNSGTYRTAEETAEWRKQQQQLEETIANTSEEVVKFYNLSKQYNLGEDNATLEYANAYAARIQAEAAAQESAFEAKYARLNGTLEKSYEAEQKQKMEKSYQDRINAAETAYKKEMLALKQALANQSITESEFQVRSIAAERVYLNHKLAINKAYGKDITDIQTRIAEQEISAQKQLQAAIQKSDDAFRREMEVHAKALDKEIDAFVEALIKEVAADMEGMDDPIKRLSELADDELKTEKASRSGKRQAATFNYDEEMAILAEKHELMLISEEEFLARKKELHQQLSRELAQIDLEAYENAAQTATTLLNQLATLSSSMQEAEFAQVEAWKEKELALVGDNADEQARIEEEAEAKKLEIQKKYADVDMAINIAKTIADGAVAAIKAFADLGPIAGGVMAAVIAATTIAQVATIVAQRNAIQNAAPGSAGAAAQGNAVGFSEGGYTGSGGRHDVAGVVHRGEYVVAAPELRDPSVARDVAAIEQKRRARLGGRRASSPGFADGGYTGDASDIADDAAQSMDAKLEDILMVLLDIYETPIPAYMLLSEYEAAKIKKERAKKYTSLRRKNG